MGFTYELICFSVKGDVVFFRNAKREDTYINNAWEMANAFNENHKLHSWVIHYDEVNFLKLNKVEICYCICSCTLCPFKVVSICLILGTEI